jgi:IS30 family transposase
MSHITKEQRYTISTMLKQGHIQSEISKLIGKDKSVISRNGDLRSEEYRSDLALRK